MRIKIAMTDKFWGMMQKETVAHEKVSFLSTKGGMPGQCICTTTNAKPGQLLKSFTQVQRNIRICVANNGMILCFMSAAKRLRMKQ